MIAERIRRALTSLLYCELAGIFLSFSICYFAFYARLAQSPGILPYHPKNLIFFFIIVFVACILTACAHFYSELRSFINYTSVSLNTYLRTSLITQIIIGVSGVIIAFFLFSARAGLIFLIYTVILCLLYFPMAKIIISLISKVYDSAPHRVNILLVGVNRRSVRFAKKMRENSYLGLHIAGFIDEEKPEALEAGEYLGKPDHVEEVITSHGIKLILFFLPMRTYYDTCNKLVHTAESMGVVTHSAGNLFERDKQPVSFFSGLSGVSHVFTLRQTGGMPSVILLRVRDALVAALIALAASPLALLIAGLVFFGLGRPLINSREVVGQGRKSFRLHSFRTQDTGGIDGEQLKEAPGGRLIRFLHLNSLPAVLNLAAGDLTLFGHRALTEAELNALPPDEQNSYQALKPGLFKG